MNTKIRLIIYIITTTFLFNNKFKLVFACTPHEKNRSIPKFIKATNVYINSLKKYAIRNKIIILKVFIIINYNFLTESRIFNFSI